MTTLVGDLHFTQKSVVFFPTTRFDPFVCLCLCANVSVYLYYCMSLIQPHFKLSHMLAVHLLCVVTKWGGALQKRKCLVLHRAKDRKRKTLSGMTYK